MSKIKRFIVNRATATLSIFDENAEKDSSKAIELSFEYLRVFAPTHDKGKNAGAVPQVFNKKQVQLLTIESVAQHGYRFIFDDHHSDIYSADYLQLLADEYQQRWQHYLEHTGTAAKSREATIEIKELK